MILTVGKVEFELFKVDTSSDTESCTMCTGVLILTNGHFVCLTEVVTTTNPNTFRQ